ncbi:MAG: radical SAM protein [Candidatus Omnitrophica bacterium]|jgi:organic radical activating enzyme|nr:radical SAM protein [Candidatus Omnitrophota bacterium]
MKKILKPIKIPDSYNYIGVFLTFACNLKCSYCINNFEGNLKKRKMISGKDWVELLNRIQSRADLPVSLQGGEPSLHPDFIYIINHLKPGLTIDILTNLQFDADDFAKKVNPNRVKRQAPYASIRVSYHPETMDFNKTASKVLALQDKGFSIGVWSVLHPKYKKQILSSQEKAKKMGIDFRLKDFLGEYRGKMHGQYKYPGCFDLNNPKDVLCKSTEFLIDPKADIFRCHHDVYQDFKPIGSLYDGGFVLEDKYRKCGMFGFCNPCDVKIKTNRFQEFGHTSVDIKFG